MFTGPTAPPVTVRRNSLIRPTSGASRRTHATAPTTGGKNSGITGTMVSTRANGMSVRDTSHASTTPETTAMVVAPMTTIAVLMDADITPGELNVSWYQRRVNPDPES